MSLSGWSATFHEGRYAEAVPLAQRLLTIRDNALDPNHPDVAISLDDLGDVARGCLKIIVHVGPRIDDRARARLCH
jgi:hypothetical protein